MSVDSSILLSQSMRSMNSYFKDRPVVENIGGALLFTWWFAGVIEDGYLFLISAFITALIYFTGLFQSIAMHLSISSYSGSALRRLLIGMWANYMYTNGDTPGPETVNIGIVINISMFMGILTTVYALLWLISKYADKIDNDNFAEINTIYLIIRGISRGVIMLGLLYSTFTKGILEYPYFDILFWAYILDPVIIFIQAHNDETIDTTELTFGNTKLPVPALRDAIFTNGSILIFTILFKGLGDPISEMWSLLRTSYILMMVIIFVVAKDFTNKFNANPLKQSVIGNAIYDVKENLENIDLDEKLGYIIDNDLMFDLNKNNSVSIDRNSVIIPIGEHKNKIEALVIGRGQSILKEGEKLRSELMEGITTMIIPKKHMKRITKELIPKRLDMIDFNQLELPSLNDILVLMDQLGFYMGNWLGSIKSELGKIKLSNYGISEIDGVTDIKLPGISVYEANGVNKVEVGSFVSIVETPELTNVRVGNFLTVIEMPKFNFVNLPFMSVLEIEGEGSVVDIMGFKISDGIDVSKLDEFRRIMMTQLDKLDKKGSLGRILADKNSMAMLNISWEGEFTPLLANKKNNFDMHRLLGSADNLLTGAVSEFSGIGPEFIQISGIGSSNDSKVFDSVNDEIENIKSSINSDNEVLTEQDYEKMDYDNQDYEILDD